MSRLAQGTTPFWRVELHVGTDQPPPVTFRPSEVFVLMPMADGGSEAAYTEKDVYTAIKGGCQAVGLIASRVDDKPGAAVIMRDVDNAIGHAEFLVFDLTGERPNVYYELGYAHGIGNHSLNILLVAREGTRIHFDIAPLRVHFYRSPDHLQALVATQLAELKRLSATRVAAAPRRPFWKLW